MASTFFPSCAITLLFLAISPAIADLIYDGRGEPLRNGKAYVIFPYHVLGSSGITVTSGKNSSSPCPLYTTLKPFTRYERHGSPITISTPPKVEYLSTDNAIEFYFNTIPSPCNRELRWYVSTPKDESEHAYIVVGVSKEFKSNYVFRIVNAKGGIETNNVYNIKFCTIFNNKFFSVSSMVEECVDVGLLPDGLLGIVTSPNLDVYFAEIVDDAKISL